eukprot:3335-Heterococcus_DN1.PRE.6
MKLLVPAVVVYCNLLTVYELLLAAFYIRLGFGCFVHIARSLRVCIISLQNSISTSASNGLSITNNACIDVSKSYKPLCLLRAQYALSLLQLQSLLHAFPSWLLLVTNGSATSAAAPAAVTAVTAALLVATTASQLRLSPYHRVPLPYTTTASAATVLLTSLCYCGYCCMLSATCYLKLLLALTCSYHRTCLCFIALSHSVAPMSSYNSANTAATTARLTAPELQRPIVVQV